MLRIIVFKRRTLFISLVLLAAIALGIFLLMAMTGSDETFSETMEYAYKKISFDQAKVLMEKNPDLIIFDVRSEKDYEEGHLPNALLISQSELQKTMEYYEKDNIYMLYGSSNRKTEKVADTMASNGFQRVYMLNDDYENWPYEVE